MEVYQMSQDVHAFLKLDQILHEWCAFFIKK